MIRSVNMIAAVDKNLAIGKDGELIAFLPKDLVKFREITTNNIIVFGRKTLAGFPKGEPLNNRINILLTTSVKGIVKENDYFYKVSSVDNALKLLSELYSKNSFKSFEGFNENPEVYICGGVRVYEDFLFLTKKIYLTEINKDLNGDVFFPSSFKESFILDKKSETLNDNNFDFTFNEYIRK